ncbi:hypothetical protein DVA76_19975, partial [Acinetobacter baumannii]
ESIQAALNFFTLCFIAAIWPPIPSPWPPIPLCENTTNNSILCLQNYVHQLLSGHSRQRVFCNIMVDKF